MIVKHKKGSFIPSNLIECWGYCFAKLGLAKEAIVEVRNIQAYTSKDQPDYLKVCGWKSGVRTQKNREQMVAYRNYNNFIEVILYNRFESRLEFSNNQYGNRISVFEQKIERPSGCLLVAAPWAGGTEPPDNNYEYDFSIKVTKWLWQK